MSANRAAELRRRIEAFADAQSAPFTSDTIREHLVASGLPDAEARMAVADYEADAIGEATMDDVAALIAELDLPPDSRQLTVADMERFMDAMEAVQEANDAVTRRLRAITERLREPLERHGTIGQLPARCQPLADEWFAAHAESVELGRRMKAGLIYWPGGE